ncbi:MAG: heme-binding domain-containing protein [Chloroflexi bacterium]|nr:heme-binding domain-containing protein [Chloroflexota bacterium]
MISRKSLKRTGIFAALLLVFAFVVVQAVPYGRNHENPPVIAEPAWDIPATRELVVRACFDCHSNKVSWPWYSNIAPLSWWIQNHVDEGRDELNFSEWSVTEDESGDIAESVMENEMPPRYYELGPNSPGLSDRERQLLIAGLVTTFGRPNGEDDEHE